MLVGLSRSPLIATLAISKCVLILMKNIWSPCIIGSIYPQTKVTHLYEAFYIDFICSVLADYESICLLANGFIGLSGFGCPPLC